MKALITLWLCCMSVGILNAQVPAIGQCPNISVVEDFNSAAYLGLWYEAEKYPFIFQIGGKCVTATYGPSDDGNVTVTNYQFNKITGTDNQIEGFARPVSPGKFMVRFPSVPFGRESPYNVIGTDYENYAVVFSCSNFGTIFNARTVWILTRERQASVATMEKAYSVLDSKRISKSFLLRTDQTNCDKRKSAPLKKQ